MDNIERIIDKIQKLLALERGTTHQAEAEAAAAKVQELLLKYNLEMDQVESHVPEEEIAVDQDFSETSERKNESNWVQNLYHVVARYNFCKVVRFPHMYTDNPYGVRIAIIGRKGNREAVKYMVEWLIPRIREAATDAWYEYEGPEKKGKFRRGFLIGCVEGIGNRLYEEWARSQEANHDTMALVVRRDGELKDWMQQHYPKLGASRARSLSSWDGRSAGNKAGRSMDIRRGVTGDQKFKGYLKGG